MRGWQAFRPKTSTPMVQGSFASMQLCGVKSSENFLWDTKVGPKLLWLVFIQVCSVLYRVTFDVKMKFGSLLIERDQKSVFHWKFVVWWLFARGNTNPTDGKIKFWTHVKGVSVAKNTQLFTGAGRTFLACFIISLSFNVNKTRFFTNYSFFGCKINAPPCIKKRQIFL